MCHLTQHELTLADDTSFLRRLLHYLNVLTHKPAKPARGVSRLKTVTFFIFMFNTMHASHKDKEFYSHVFVTEYQYNNINNIMLKMY